MRPNKSILLPFYHAYTCLECQNGQFSRTNTLDDHETLSEILNCSSTQVNPCGRGDDDAPKNIIMRVRNHSHWFNVSLGSGPQVYLAAISIYLLLLFFASPMEGNGYRECGNGSLSAVWPIKRFFASHSVRSMNLAFFLVAFFLSFVAQF